MKKVTACLITLLCAPPAYSSINQAEYDEVVRKVQKVVSDPENVKELRYAYETNKADKEARELAHKWKMPEEIIDRFNKLYKRGRGLAKTEADFKEDFSQRANSPMSFAVLIGLKNEIDDKLKKEEIEKSYTLAIERYRRDRSEDNMNYLKQAVKKQNRQGSYHSVPYFSPDLGKKDFGVTIFENWPYVRMFEKLQNTRKDFQEQTEKMLKDKYGSEMMKRHPRKEHYYPDYPYGKLVSGDVEKSFKYFNDSAYRGDGVLKESRKPPSL